MFTRNRSNLVLSVVVIGTVFKLMGTLGLMHAMARHTSRTSSVDGKRYDVLVGPNETMIADTLARVRQGVCRVVTHMSTFPDGPFKDEIQTMTRRIGSRGERLRLAELDAKATGQVAYTRNKGEVVFLCMYRDPERGTLASEDQILFIALHELAHIMQKSYEPMRGHRTNHSDAFRRIEDFVYKAASNVGLLHRERFIGTEYCGSTIPAPKLRKTETVSVSSMR